MENYELLNDLRDKILHEHYDPLTGYGACGPRRRLKYYTRIFYLPVAMFKNPECRNIKVESREWRLMRCRYDFEYWCATCAYIKPKRGFKPVLCVLNEGQRSVVEILEQDRAAGKPLRAIILKARQWGCSTLIQLYIAWLQTCVSTGVNGAICAHLKNTSATIRGMYTRLLANYPADMWQGNEKPELKNFEGSIDIKKIAGRDCTIMLCSCINPDAVRGNDLSLAHLTEVAFWRNSPAVVPEDVAQAVYGTVDMQPGTMVVMESTANGVGNFFHREWLRSKTTGCSRAIFVPWCELSANSRRPEDIREFVRNMDDKEKELFASGLSIGQLYWRRCKRLEMDSEERFNAEFPLTDTDAFVSTECNVFDSALVEELRADCVMAFEKGGVCGIPIRFTPSAAGRLRVWHHPEAGKSYVAAVDVGGRSAAADWSVVAVLSRGRDDELPEVVAQWRGHIDHDLLAAKAMEIGRYYNNALLVVESNTLETERTGADSAYVLAEMARTYPNMYVRRSYDKVSGNYTRRYGFHTNRSTKPMLIGNLIAAVRGHTYVEHDNDACDEMLNYRQHPDGSYGADAPLHDDILMTRAIALFIIATESDTRIDLSTLPTVYEW